MRAKTALVLWSAVASTLVAPARAAVPAPTNPIGTPTWLPAHANERADVPSFADRLVVVYDRSLDQAAGAVPLEATGPFVLKVASPMPGSAAMDGSSPRVSRLVEGSIGGFEGRVAGFFTDFVIATVRGDVRDGDCAKLGSPEFSYAYSTTRTVIGDSEYRPAPCERVDASVAREDGSVLSTVTTFVPGFWLDMGFWTYTSMSPREQHELRYAAVFDGDGDAVPERAGYSTATVDRPSQWSPPLPQPDVELRFAAHPGAFGEPCPTVAFVYRVLEGALEGSWHERTFVVPDGTSAATFTVRPTVGYWNVRITDPLGRAADMHSIPGFTASRTFSNESDPPLVPGELHMRACNVAGEPEIVVDVFLD